MIRFIYLFILQMSPSAILFFCRCCFCLSMCLDKAWEELREASSRTHPSSSCSPLAASLRTAHFGVQFAPRLVSRWCVWPVAARHCLLAAGTLRGDTYMLIIARCTPTSFVCADYALNLRPWNRARVGFVLLFVFFLPFLSLFVLCILPLCFVWR